ncbi:MAG: SRPBCC domain-containing protein [Chloroflexota bacterium]|nr:SRPBCC domain-containing protein [Chloroflexota bacterium]
MTTIDGNYLFEGRGEREIVMAYSFDAPPERVFEAWNDTSGMANWYGPAEHELIVAEQDFRVGGSWRYGTRDESGEETVLYGVYQEIEPGSRMVNTEIFAGMPDFETVVTVTFEAEGGGTRMTSVVLHPGKESRDGAMAWGMEAGVQQTFERFAAHLADTQK